MAQVNKSTMIGEYCTNSFKYWYALSWMPIFPDGNN